MSEQDPAEEAAKLEALITLNFMMQTNFTLEEIESSEYIKALERWDLLVRCVKNGIHWCRTTELREAERKALHYGFVAGRSQRKWPDVQEDYEKSREGKLTPEREAEILKTVDEIKDKFAHGLKYLEDK